MFTHIMVGANDIEASKTFYDAVLGTLGCKPGILSINTTNQKRYIYIHEKKMFIISEPINGEPASIGNGSTIGFSVPDVETGNAWHQAGLDNGGESCEDPQYPRCKNMLDMICILPILEIHLAISYVH